MKAYVHVAGFAPYERVECDRIIGKVILITRKNLKL